MCKIKKITPKQKQNKSKGKNVKVSLLELENQTNGINVRNQEKIKNIIANNWSSIGNLLGKINGIELDTKKKSDQEEVYNI
tara:strand:+ start:2227 stop:2469 length:243 start_codon:yes stop_codon:yes gene_type:complete